MGVGLMIQGVYTMSGTYTFVTGTEITFPAYTAVGARQHRTQFRFAELSCTYGSTQIPSITTRPLELAGGTSALTVSTPSTSSSNCTPYQPGGGMSKKTSTASTFAKGVAIKPKIGIDLSSRTGFTTTARRKVDFAKAGKLCGVSGVPAGSPGLLVVK